MQNTVLVDQIMASKDLGKLNLIVDIKEEHRVTFWRTEDNGHIKIRWDTIYIIENGELRSIHRYINKVRHGLTEAYFDSRCVAEVVYVNGEYKRIMMHNNGPIKWWSSELGRPIDITCLCD